MKHEKFRFALSLLFFCLMACSASSFAQDMRENEMAADEKKKVLLEKIRQEENKARKEAAESRQRILSDKAALLDTVGRLEAQVKAAEKENLELTRERENAVSQSLALKERLGETDAVIRALAGYIRASAKDLDALVDQGLQSAVEPTRGDRLEKIAQQESFPGMDDILYMVDLFFDETQKSGEVRIKKNAMISRTGEETIGDILILGNFTAAYQLEKEIGFLSYLPEERRFYAMPKLPSGRIKRSIKHYMAGQSLHAPIDLSRGAALRLMSHRFSFFELIKKGGPIVWPIIGILVLAIFIVIERLVFFARKRLDTESFMKEINTGVSEKKWDHCRSLCYRHPQKPLPGIILAGIHFKDRSREDMESAIQETILREIPPMERFLSTMGMLATIAPLLGLLGTVTGMINTFHVITFYGTGDPRMMSSGISEALVTTMLGLAVAIPIMFVHTLLSRRVETMIGEMEEKAVSFVNNVYKTRIAS